MKRIITALLLIASTATADEFALACTADKFTADKDKITHALCYVMFRSDYQNDYMTNGVLWQFTWSGREAGGQPVYVWRYSDLKAQKMDASDKAYIANLLNDAELKTYHGNNVEGWLDGFSTRSTNEIPSPVVIGAYDDKPMQNSDPIYFVSMFLPSVASQKQAIIIDNWLTLANVPDTPANRQKVIDATITDEYVLASNTNQPVYVIYKNIKKLPNATLTQRDSFRSELNEPVKATLGFMRNSQEANIMQRYGVKKK